MVSGQSEVDISMQKELEEVDKMYLQEERQIEQVSRRNTFLEQSCKSNQDSWTVQWYRITQTDEYSACNKGVQKRMTAFMDKDWVLLNLELNYVSLGLDSENLLDVRT